MQYNVFKHFFSKRYSLQKLNSASRHFCMTEILFSSQTKTVHQSRIILGNSVKFVDFYFFPSIIILYLNKEDVTFATEIRLR